MNRNLRKGIYNKKMSYHKYVNILKSTFKIDVLVAVNLQIFGAQLNHICLIKLETPKTNLF